MTKLVRNDITGGMKSLRNIYEAKTNLSALILEMEASGKGFVICRRGKPVADVVPHRCRRPSAPLFRVKESLDGAVYDGDPTAPLDEKDWPEGLR